MKRKLMAMTAVATITVWMAWWASFSVGAARTAETLGAEFHVVSAAHSEQISDQTSVQLGTALTVLGVAFGAWATVLGYVIFVVRHEFSALRETVHEESERRRTADERAHQDRIQIERRLAELEAMWRFNGADGRREE